MNVITGNAEPVHRNAVPSHTYPQPFPVDIPIPGKLQQKPPVMTPVRQVEGIPLSQISRGSWHSLGDYATNHLILKVSFLIAKTTSKAFFKANMYRNLFSISMLLRLNRASLNRASMLGLALWSILHVAEAKPRINDLMSPAFSTSRTSTHLVG
jgi:hypothetical protein